VPSVLVNGRPYQLPDHPNYKVYQGQSDAMIHVGLIDDARSLCGRPIPETAKLTRPDERLCLRCQDGLRRMGMLA